MKLRQKYFSPQLPFFLLEECSHPDYPKHIFYLIKHPSLDIIHEPYTPSYSHSDSSLDLLQAIFLALAPFAIAENSSIAWQPDVVHCHDWLCGLFPYFNHNLSSLLPNFSSRKIPSIFTIHNASYVGVFGDLIADNFYSLLRQWGLTIAHNFQVADLKFAGQINLLATGLRYAEKINTVSPTHAKELLQENSGISTILQKRHKDFCGILNGVDDNNWNPSSDPFLQKHTYGVHRREVHKAKLYWKKYLQEQLQITINTKIPLFISICRIVSQKGLGQMLGFDQQAEDSKDCGGGPLVEALANHRCHLIILGEGEQQLELQLQMLAWQYAHSFTFLNYFHEEMAHMLTAAADFFLMPSLYEPCGLNQIYSMRYGTVPIVRKTGGLADTIQHRVNGLVFNTIDDLRDVLAQAFYLWQRRPRQLWALKQYGMQQDFSWKNNLHEYIHLYNECLASSVAPPKLKAPQTGHEPF